MFDCASGLRLLTPREIKQNQLETYVAISAQDRLRSESAGEGKTNKEASTIPWPLFSLLDIDKSLTCSSSTDDSSWSDALESEMSMTN